MGDSRSFERSLGRSQQSMSRWSTWVKRAGAVAAAGFGAAIVATGAATVDFDKSMRNVNSIAQLNERQFQKLQKSVLSLAGPTAQAPKTIAEGMYDLVSSGFSAGEALHIVEKSAKAATAGLTTTEVSTAAVAAVLNAYHLPAKKAGEVSDQLFRTVDRGVISFEDLASNVGDVLPFASSLGVGLDQVGASIATMTKAGISAPETMTRVKNVMVAMLKPGEGLRKAIKELGFESGEQLVKTKGFQGGLEALIGTTDGSKKAVAKLFPEIRAMGGALALTGKNAKGARDDLEGMRQSAGATNKALSEQSKSISYAWNQIKAEVTAAAIGIGSQAVPAIMNFVREVRTGTGVGGDFRHAIENIGTAIAPFAVAAGQVSLAVGRLGLDFAQTQAAMVLVGAAVGALTGRMVALGVVFAAGKIIPFAAAVARTVSVLQSAIAVSGALRTAMILLTSATRGMSLAMASTGIGLLAVVAGTAIGALMGFSKASDDSANSQRDLAGAIKGTHDALDSIANAGLDAKQAKIDHRVAVANLKDAEAQLAAARKNPNATAGDIERAEIAKAQARVDLKRKTRDLRNSERDYQDTVRSGLSEAARNIQTLRDERNAKRDARNETKGQVGALKAEIAMLERSGATTDLLRPKLEELRKKKRELRAQTAAAKDAQKNLAAEIRGVRDTANSAAPKIKNFGDKLRGLKPFTKVELELVMAGTPPLRDLSDSRPKKPKGNRKGGWATFQDGGLVPSILSPGEVGILPNGSSFTVPGARVAADTYPMMLPQGTAVLTDHGQQLAAMGWPLDSVIANQAPHFRDGGLVGATKGAASLIKAGVKDPRQLVIQTATGGRESRWNEKAKGGPNRNGTYDHGWLQANDIWASKMGKLWGQRYTFEGGSKIAKRIADAQGPSAWNLNGWTSDSTIAPYMGTAEKAVKRAMGGKGYSYPKVTQPKVTRPVVQSMLQPLRDDALMAGIEAGRSGEGSRWQLLQETLEGIVPQSEDRPRRERVNVAGATGGRTAAGGGWGGSKALVMRAIRGFHPTYRGYTATFKRAYNTGSGVSDHWTASKAAFAADIAPGDDVFGTVRRRLGVPAVKGSWNIFNNAPVAGYRSQLLWHAPDGTHKDHVHLGIRKMRKGGLAGKRPKPKKLTVARLVKQLGGSPGTAGADKLTRQLAGRVNDASFKKLRSAERQAKRQIRGMAKNGFTGAERIQARRLRGALSLLQDEQGHRIGEMLGRSDFFQGVISRNEANLPHHLALQGIDPESLTGLQRQREVANYSLAALQSRQRQNQQALRQAKRTGDKGAIAAAQAELDEVADQMLGLRASIKDLDQSIEQQIKEGPKNWANAELAMAGLTEGLDDDKAALTKLEAILAGDLTEALASNDPLRIAEMAGALSGVRDQIKSLDETMQQTNELVRQREEFEKERLDLDKRFAALAETQGPAFMAAFAQWLDGAIGGPVARRAQLPFSPGVNAGYM